MPPAGAGAVEYDLDMVSGIEHFPQDPALRALLATNGFAGMADALAVIARKQLAGDALSEESCAWVSVFHAAKSLENPASFNGGFNPDGDMKQCWTRLLLGIATDHTLSPQHRYTALTELSALGPDIDTARALAPLLNDETILGENTRAAVLAADVICRAFERDEDTPSETREEQEALIQRAREAIQRPDADLGPL